MHDAVDVMVPPLAVIWESTQACDLACVHCRATVQPRRNPAELTTEEGLALIDDVAAMDPRVFVIAGGDPLKREDLYDLILHAKECGLDPALRASATPLLTEGAVALMQRYGLSRLAVDLDASSAEPHDSLRRSNGSFDKTVRAIRMAVRIGIQVQVNTTVTRRTIDDLPRIAAMLTELGIALWSVSFLIPSARGRRGDLVSPEGVEHLFAFLYETTKRVPFAIRTIEAMHYRRYALQRLAVESGHRVDHLRDRETGLIDPFTPLIDQRLLLRLGLKSDDDAIPRAPYGMHEGRNFLFVSHTGDVFPNGSLPLKGGNVRDQPLSAISRTSELFLSLRDSNNLKGRCGRCEFRELCGGSRARAWSMTGDAFESDPLCEYQPRVA